MQIIETERFFKVATLWFCKRCAEQNKNESSATNKTEQAPAKWLDSSHHLLYCPVCGTQEEIDRA